MRSRRPRFVLWGVAILLLAGGCSGPANHVASTTASPVTSATGPATPAYVARTAPASPVGSQLTWMLSAVKALPLTPQVVDAHFDSTFLAQVGVAELNDVFGEFSSSSGATLVGILSESPTSLKAVVLLGGTKVTLTMAVDLAGLISGLLLAPVAPPPPTSWAQLDRELAAIAPDTSFLAARLSPAGTCIPIHRVASSTPRPLASMFKLFVLGALARQIAAGRVSWKQELTVQSALKSVGSVRASLQFSPVGTKVSVQETATKMISISDNTAADMLINLVGRSAVEAQVHRWSGSATLDDPFLTTREMFLLHYVDFPVLADRYLALAPDRRAAFLASSVDPLSLDQIRASTGPRDVDSIEWSASASDLCHAWAGLQRLAGQSRLAPIRGILSVNTGGIGLDRTRWPTVWFKGGSEPGVLTLGFLAKNDRGQTFVVVALTGDPAKALPPTATADLIALVKGAFGLVR